ncbi:MAG: flagellin, partial [Clostridia bacterium]|nr:flagellin [Clostridia bacterium]
MKDFGLKFVSSAKVNDGDTYTMKVLGGSNAKDAEIADTIKINQSEEVAAKEASYDTVITASNGEKMSSSALKFEFGDGFGFDEDGNAVESTSFNVNVDASNALVFHIGANSGQNTTLNMNNMNSASLGVDSLDLTTQKGADAAITTIDAAITTVSAQRSALGAMQNRLEHTINNLSTTSENLSASESQIRDVDMAK